MSNSLIDRSADLKSLRDAGYAMEVRGAYLIVKDVPYLTSPSGELAKADMVTSIELAGNTPPSDHTVWLDRQATIPGGWLQHGELPVLWSVGTRSRHR